MLDTITVVLSRDKFDILRPEMFIPNAKIINSPGVFLVPCKNNPTADDKKEGRYMPCMTLIKRPRPGGVDITLRVQFSAPKLLWSNNANEVTEKDFEDVIGVLHDKMLEKGVFAHEEDLAGAPVSVLHPAKNFALNGYTSDFVIRELEKININNKLDHDSRDFKNHGHSAYFSAKAHSLTFYDKRKDLEQSAKRAIDKDQNFLQRPLSPMLTELGVELLRMEARLENRQKIKSTLKELGYLEEPTFASVFSAELCQKILIKYWHELIEDKNIFLFGLDLGPQRLYHSILKKHSKMTAREATYLVGLNALSKDKGGIGTLRRITQSRSKSQRSWYRVNQDLKKLNHLPIEYHGWVKQIQDGLSTFEAYRLPLDE